VTGTWTDALDEFEARLVLAEAVLELGGDGEPLPPVEPASLAAPFPADLAGRARALLERAAAVEQGLGAEQHRIRAELARLPRLTPPTDTISRLDVQA
jgi:hypothetical protein